MLCLTVIVDWKLDFYLTFGSTAISHLEENLKEQFQAPKFHFFSKNCSENVLENWTWSIQNWFYSCIYFSSSQLKFVRYPGWGAIRKWPLIIRSPTHTVCSQTIITGSGFWFRMGIVWSGVNFGWERSDQWSIPDGIGLIRGQFRMGMVLSGDNQGEWSEFSVGHGRTIVWTMVWGGRKMFRRWSYQWPFWSGDSLIGHLKRTIVWAMVARSSGQWSGGGLKMFRRWSDQWPFWSGDSLIRGHLTRTIVWTMVWISSGLWLHNFLAMVWFASDQWSIPDGNGMIRDHFERTFSAHGVLSAH